MQPSREMVSEPSNERESFRPHLEDHLDRPVAAIHLPPENPDKDAEEARRRLLGTWPGIVGNRQRLHELACQRDALRRRRQVTPGWNVLAVRRLAAEESRLLEEEAQHRKRLAGLFESALDNYAILKAAGAVVLFEES